MRSCPLLQRPWRCDRGPVRFRINLADTGIQARRKAGYGLSALIFVLLVLVGIELACLRAMGRVEADMDLRANGMRAETARLRGSVHPTEQSVRAVEDRLRKEVSLLNDLMAQRRFSWSRLLTELEQRVPNNLSVTDIQTDGRDGTILLDGEAYSLKELSEFSKRLEESRHFLEVFLAREERRDSDDGPVTAFSMKFRYRPVEAPK